MVDKFWVIKWSEILVNDNNKKKKKKKMNPEKGIGYTRNNFKALDFWERKKRDVSCTHQNWYDDWQVKSSEVLVQPTVPPLHFIIHLYHNFDLFSFLFLRNIPTHFWNIILNVQQLSFSYIFFHLLSMSLSTYMWSVYISIIFFFLKSL